MKTTLRFLLPLLLLVSFLRADTDQIITQARAYLGTEAALDAVTSLRYTGQLETHSTTIDGESSSTTATIVITFLEPTYQRIHMVSEDRIETTALDDYEAWQRVENPNDATQWRMSLLDTGQIRRLRANTWENVSFLKGLTEHGGTIENLGMAELDGQQVHKLAYDHGNGIVFYRYIDPTTGRLLLSETDTGAKIVESGVNIVDGVRFPSEMVTTSEQPDGSTQLVRIVFDSVEVNPVVDRLEFRMPSLSSY